MHSHSECTQSRIHQARLNMDDDNGVCTVSAIAATFVIATGTQAQRIKDIIREDTIALQKWGSLIYRFKLGPPEVLRIKNLLHQNKFDEAIAETLAAWMSARAQAATFDALLDILEKEKLQSLVAQLEENVHKIRNRKSTIRRPRVRVLRQEQVDNSAELTPLQMKANDGATDEVAVAATKNMSAGNLENSPSSCCTKDFPHKKKVILASAALAVGLILAGSIVAMLTHAGRAAQKPKGDSNGSALSVGVSEEYARNQPPARPPASKLAPVKAPSIPSRLEAVAIAEVNLKGTVEKFVDWTTLGLNVQVNCSKASHLNFEYVDLGNEPDKFLEAIASCRNLRSLKIVNAKWTGNFTTKILLPQLEDFYLSRDPSSRGVSRRSGPAFLAYVASLIFFQKSLTKWTSLEEVAVLNANISASSGWPLGQGPWQFNFSPQNRSLELHGLRTSFLPWFSARFELHSLQLVDCELQESDFTRLTSLNTIFIASALPIAPVPPNLSRIFRKLLKLQEVFFGESRSTLELTDLRSRHLESLTIYDSAVTVSGSEVELFKFELLAHLKNLHLHNVRMDASMLAHFDTVFQNVRLFQVTSSSSEVDRYAIYSVQELGRTHERTVIKFEITESRLYFACPIEYSCTKPACGLQWNAAEFVDGGRSEICASCVQNCNLIDKPTYGATLGALASEYEPPSWTTMGSLHLTRVNGFVFLLL